MSGAGSPRFDLAGKRIWVAGHKGMVGSALMRRLASEGCTLLTVGRDQLDLRCQADVRAWFDANRPDAVILAAAKVGGIAANAAYPADFCFDNLAIQTNVIEGAWRAGARKLVFLASSAVYPQLAPQPMAEDLLLSGQPDPNHEGYALAKLAGIALVRGYRRQHGADFVTVLPTNLYGPGDNYHATSSHVVPAMLRKFHEAKLSAAETVTLWGTGTPMRELMHVDDMADACVRVLVAYSELSPINIGVGSDLTIRDLAETIRAIVGYDGRIVFDTSKPDGVPKKLLDTSRLQALGWRPRIDLKAGLRATYDWYVRHAAEARGS
ncbi:GDP-L-fucose synthase family protein [Marinivivus vitaminiproducens]|uniref:GDP-L-fucose synthase family protein n=1 Tax=Marinivivus vitaminiproducens TaxID=3035935 RepID=UPI0027A4870A|nr:GDP-L-fucose synthase [Geminicoccaceae bacterium SCSIO 64248]